MEIHTQKAEKNAVILAHYYVEPQVQEIADFVGDSYYLAKIAKSTDAKFLSGIKYIFLFGRALTIFKAFALVTQTSETVLSLKY